MDVSKFIESYQATNKRLLLFDYDGVLVPIMPRPEQATPSGDAKRLLKHLSNDIKNTVVIISGRPHDVLQDWLGAIDLQFVAEHGVWRKVTAEPWQKVENGDLVWMDDVELIMSQAISGVKGGIIERKHAALALHYRDIATADFDALAVMASLQQIVSSHNLNLLDGKKVIEVVAKGVDKGTAAQFWLQSTDWDFICSIGDDVTDEALFEMLPSDAISIKVGPGETAATSRLDTQEEVIGLLKKLAES